MSVTMKGRRLRPAEDAARCQFHLTFCGMDLQCQRQAHRFGSHLVEWSSSEGRHVVEWWPPMGREK